MTQRFGENGLLPRPTDEADLIEALGEMYAVLPPDLYAKIKQAFIAHSNRASETVVDASRDMLETARGQAQEARFIAHLITNISINHNRLRNLKKSK